MVGLAEKLVAILEDKKNDWNGEDIERITTAILTAEAYEDNKADTKLAETQQDKYVKLGQEYMYGGKTDGN